MSLLDFLNGFGKNYIVAPTNYSDNLNNGFKINENNTYLYTCVNIISSNFSKLKIDIKDGDNKIINDHPLYYKLNHNYNKYQNKQTILSTLEVHRNNYGNSFLWKKSNDEYVIIPPENVYDYEIKNGNLIYKILPNSDPKNKDKYPSEIDSKKLIHFKTISKNGVFGLDPLSEASETIIMLNNAGSTINNFYKNGAHSSYALESSVPSTENGTKLSYSDRENFNSQNVGVQNAGKVVKLPFGHKLTPLQLKFVDMQLVDTVKFSRDAITSLFNIPNSFLNEQDSNKNIEQDTRTFKTMCIAPIANIYENELNFKLLSEDERKKGIHISFDLESLVEIDLVTKIDTYSKGIDKGIFTPSFVSNLFGQNNDTEYAKYHYQQAQMIPMEHYQNYNPLLKDDPNLKSEKNNEND